MYTSDRGEMRKVFFNAWSKHQQHLPLEALEVEIINVITLHPEYRPLLEQPERYQDHDFHDNNPFLHLSLHLAIREQIQMDRPKGIQKIFHAATNKWGDVHTVEHKIMDCLAQFIWEGQQSGITPDENKYLDYLNRIL